MKDRLYVQLHTTGPAFEISGISLPQAPFLSSQLAHAIFMLPRASRKVTTKAPTQTVEMSTRGKC